MKMTMYVVLTTKLALYNYQQRTNDDSVTILNDKLGDFAYVNRAQAIAEGKKAFETPEMEGEKNVTVINVIFDHQLHEALAYGGHVRQDVDYAGNPIWRLDQTACRELNAKARMLMEVFPLPIVGRTKITFLAPGNAALN